MEPWEHILNVLKYTNQDVFTVTADQIKECKNSWKGKANQFEPRLLCYQTSANHRSEIFKKNGIYILPIKNGTYLLCKMNTYMSLDYSSLAPVIISRDKSSLVLGIGDSETSIIDNLRYTGVFERPELLGEPITHGPLLNGRHRITMEMKLGNQDISINGVQFETDSCYESRNKILIIEGKSSATTIDSFNIRQLYFPFREVYRVTSGKKEIICVFIHNLNGIIHIWKYGFSDINKMDSIEVKGHYTYKFSS
jgi:hypothetical protein